MAPGPQLPKGGNDWRYKNKTGGQVQGSPRRPGQRPLTVAEEAAQKAKDRADRNQKKPPPKDNPAGPRKSTPGTGVPGMTVRVPVKPPYTPPKPKGGPGPGRTIHNPEPGGFKVNSQPGPGAPTGGTGKDADGGKQRGQFEDDRRGRMQGGKDRPPIYKPQDDGQRGGYVNRSSKAPPIPTGKPIPKKKPGINTGGPVRGLTTMVP